MIVLKEYLEVLNALNINERQFTTLLSVHLSAEGDKTHIAAIKEFIFKQGVVKDDKRVLISHDEMVDLVTKSLITNVNAKLEVTDKFRSVLNTPASMFDEMWNTYPSFAIINSTNIPLKSGNRLQLQLQYLKTIKSSIVEHNRILDDIRYGKKHKLIVMNITNFINSKFWEALREQRLSISELVANDVAAINDVDL